MSHEPLPVTGDDALTWDRLASLLPEPEARQVRECWAIGEQEAGLGLLVSALLEHEIPVSETTRAQIAVTAETWGVLEALTPSLATCRSDGSQPSVRLAELAELPGEDEDEDTGAETRPVLVPWIACTRCGQTLVRAHAREPWGLSYLADHYAIVSPDQAATARVFPADAAGPAFDSLLRDCPAS
ncbi:hypothetical protein [Longispora albida]|uniref:hypothetical protein n=1 Tax=Longispora albida TaxID=203523 RepID=UPI00036B69F0|nr:hypothetical protein [Longispora albida]